MIITLDHANIGNKYRICGIDCEENKKRRYFDLGMILGTTLEKTLESPSKDPCAYKVRGAVFSLRNTDARDILVTQC